MSTQHNAKSAEFRPIPNENELSPERAETITKNFELADQFLQNLLDDPELANHIPDNGSVILLPTDDPTLAESNRRGGERMADAGASVIFYEVRKP